MKHFFSIYKSGENKVIYSFLEVTAMDLLFVTHIYLIIFKMLCESTSTFLIVATLENEPFIKHLLKVFRGYA